MNRLTGAIPRPLASQSEDATSQSLRQEDQSTADVTGFEAQNHAEAAI